MQLRELLTTPNILSLTRLIIAPLFLPFFLVYLLPFNIFFLNIVLALLFLGLSLTDFFDGYYARKLGLSTPMGSLLDLIADKFLLYATLIALLTAHKIFFYWVIILIGREFFVMGLRLIALQQNIIIAASWPAKIKTCIEIVYLAVVIANPYQLLQPRMQGWNKIEHILLMITLLLSISTAYGYYKSFISLSSPPKEPDVY